MGQAIFTKNFCWFFDDEKMWLWLSLDIEKTSLALPLTTEVALNDPDDYDNNIFEEKNKSVKWAMPQLKKKRTRYNQEPPFKPNLIESSLEFFPLLLTIENMCDAHWIFYNSAILVFFIIIKNPFKFKNKTKISTEISWKL